MATLLSCKAPLEKGDDLSVPFGCSRHFSDFSRLQEMVHSAQISLHWEFAYADHSLTAHVQQYLGEHVQQRITIGDVAKAFYISEVYLSELFKKHTGMTVIHFIHHIRLRRAAALLRDTELSIKEIAEAVGYDDPSYFGRRFKKGMGVSPEHYRKFGASAS